jgi:hypothetical protein
MNNPYSVVLRNGIMYRVLNNNFRSVNLASEIIDNKKEMILSQGFIHPNLLGHLPAQVTHKVHFDNLLNTFIGVKLHQDNKVNITSGCSIQEDGRLN